MCQKTSITPRFSSGVDGPGEQKVHLTVDGGAGLMGTVVKNLVDHDGRDKARDVVLLRFHLYSVRVGETPLLVDGRRQRPVGRALDLEVPGHEVARDLVVVRAGNHHRDLLLRGDCLRADYRPRFLVPQHLERGVERRDPHLLDVRQFLSVHVLERDLGAPGHQLAFHLVDVHTVLLDGELVREVDLLLDLVDAHGTYLLFSLSLSETR